MTKEQNSKITKSDSSINIPKFTIRQLLEAGVHFGHKTMRRNTKMSKYLFGVRNGLSIIDLQKTGYLLHESLKIVNEVAKNNGKILFVATKKQASEVIADAAKKCGQYYVNHRWLGGMLTNWQTISKSIKTLRDIEGQLKNDDLGLNKKEKLVLERKRQKLEDALGGIKEMGGYPDLVFIIDTHRESLAILEAKKIKVPVMAILDSNCNPDNVTYPIPGNDDSIKSIRLYCHLISEAALAGARESSSNSGVINSKQSQKNKHSAAVKENKTIKLDKIAEEAKKIASQKKDKNILKEESLISKSKASSAKIEVSASKIVKNNTKKDDSVEVKTIKAITKKVPVKKLEKEEVSK